MIYGAVTYLAIANQIYVILNIVITIGKRFDENTDIPVIHWTDQ